VSNDKIPARKPVGKRLFKQASLSPKDRAVLARSILLEETSPPGLLYGVVWIVAGLLAAFIIWATITRLDERASAPGEVLTQAAVTPIQHLEGGIVSDLLVKEGQRVTAGTPLLRLDPTAASAEFEGLRARAAALALQIARLRATALGEPLDFGPESARYPGLAADQKELYESQQGSLAAQQAVADAQILAREQELRGLQARETSLSEQLQSLDARVALENELSNKQLGRRSDLLDAERAAAQVRGEIEQVRAEQARARAAIAEAEGRKLEAAEGVRGQALDRLGQLSAERAEVMERIRRLEDRYTRTELRAPIAGIVAGLKLAEGSVIAPGDTLMEIVPEDDTVLAQVRISPRDIGYIEVGQPALIKVDSYSFSRQGGVTGTVERLSATSFKTEDGGTYFEAQLSLDQPYVGPDPKANRLTPGMTLVADIKTGEKSLMAYLWRPVSHSLSDAFGER